MKKALIILFTLTLIVLSTVVVFAASGSYNSSYDMTGGVYSQDILIDGNNGKIVVNLIPTKGYNDHNIDVYLQKKGLLGVWSGVTGNNVSSVYNSTSTFSNLEKGTYRIYLRNWSGQQMTGKSTISWSY